MALGALTGVGGDSPGRARPEVEASLRALHREARTRVVVGHHLKARPAGRGVVRIAMRADRQVVLVLVLPPLAVAPPHLRPPLLAVDIGTIG